MTCEATVDLAPFYRPRHAAPARVQRSVAVPQARGWDWSRWVLPPARFVGGLLLDLAICAVTFVVFLLAGSAVVDLYLFWRR